LSGIDSFEQINGRLNNTVLIAARCAFEAHDGQLRKYSNRPYIEHPMRVAGRVSLLPETRDWIVAAAWLHDVLEDTAVTEDDIFCKWKLPRVTIDLVKELTNPSKGLNLPREERKKMDREHLYHASEWAKRLKLIDRIDNIRDMTGAEKGWKHKYAEETMLLLSSLLDIRDRVNKILYLELCREIETLIRSAA